MQENDKQKKEQLDDYKKIVRMLKIAKIAIAAIMILCCLWGLVQFKTHRVSGQSMAATLENNDYILINRKKQLHRYDIVTFSPKDNSEASYVKRIVGKPGDTIWFEENKLFINYQLKSGSIQPASDTDKRAIDLPDGTIKVNVSVAVMNQLKNFHEIPENMYFLLGDNRNESTDSRMMGLIGKEQIEGVVIFRYFPLTKVGDVR